jgi:hypothetical protein
VATIAKNLFSGLGTASLANTYVAPANTKAIIKAATLCNDTGATVACTVKIIAASGGTARTVVDERSLVDKETYLCPELINLVLEAGGSIQILGLNVAFVLSGVEVN